MHKIILISLFIITFLHYHFKANSQIPNSDFEFWTHFGGPMSQNEFDNPDYWHSSNTMGPVSSSVGKDSINVYNGNYSAKLITAGSAAYLKTGFLLAIHPYALEGYIMTTLNDSDTISFKILLFNNNVVVDSGIWLGTTNISSFSQIWTPITQNASVIDSAAIEIICGNHVGTTLTVDYLSLNNSSAIPNKDQVEINNTIEVYPNPAKDYFRIKLNINSNNETFISLYNELGCEIKTELNDRLYQGFSQFTIDVSGLPAGFYFLKTISGVEVNTRKILKL